jgi:hypothetical protein
MRAHLSSEQISKWLADDRSPDVEQHIRECSKCAAETKRLKNLFAEFRDSAVAWSAVRNDAEAPERWKPPERRYGFAAGILRWKLAAAMLVIVLCVSVYKNLSDRRREAESFRADVRLWEEVNAQVSRQVPASLEPLIKLIAWEPEVHE